MTKRMEKPKRTNHGNFGGNKQVYTTPRTTLSVWTRDMEFVEQINEMAEEFGCTRSAMLRLLVRFALDHPPEQIKNWVEDVWQRPIEIEEIK